MLNLKARDYMDTDTAKEVMLSREVTVTIILEEYYMIYIPTCFTDVIEVMLVKMYNSNEHSISRVYYRDLHIKKECGCCGRTEDQAELIDLGPDWYEEDCYHIYECVKCREMLDKMKKDKNDTTFN